LTSWEINGPKIVQLGQSDFSFHRLAALNSVTEYLEEDQARALVRALASDDDQNVRLTANQILKSINEEEVSNEELNLPSSQKRDSDLLQISFNPREAAECQLALLQIDPIEPNIAFPIPQANSLEKIIEAIAERQTAPNSAELPRALSSLSMRQVAYYENAIGFLGLEDFSLTSPESVVDENKLAPEDFSRFVIHVLARHSVLRRLAQRSILGLEELPPEALELMTSVWISEIGLEPLARETLARRTQCIGSWLNWIMDSVLQNNAEVVTVPPAVNLNNHRGMLDFLLKTQTNTSTSSTPKRKKSSRSGSGSSTAMLHFPTVLRRLGRVRDSEETTLEKTGQRIGVTRERVRQLEKHFSVLGVEAIRNDGSELFRAVESFTRAPSGICLSQWSLACAKLSVIESLSLRNENFSELAFRFSNRGVPSESLRSSELADYFGPEPPFTFDGSRQNGALMGTFLLRLTLEQAGFKANAASDFQWIHSHAPKVESKSPSPADLSRRKRIARIEAALAGGPLRSQEIADITGEKNAHSLREFMRRQPAFSLYNGFWALASSNEFKPGAGKFSSVYEAVLHILDEYGPMENVELSAKMDELYPVSWGRIHQAIDHEKIGRLGDGRVGLVSHGASKKPEKEPTIPGALLYSPPVARLSISISKDHLRGSGFGAPRWLGWKLGLTATPHKAIFHAPNGSSLKIARRGGAIQFGSIRNLLTEQKVEIGCLFELTFDLEKFLVVGAHTCAKHS